MNKIFIILFLSFYNLFFINGFGFAEENKVKIGLLVPLSGDNGEIGQSIVKATQLAVNKINNPEIEIFPKDTLSVSTQSLPAIELEKLGVDLVIGPVFYENLVKIKEIKELTFLSFTNKTLNLPKNVISTGINSTSQLNTIKKFINQNIIKKLLILS